MKTRRSIGATEIQARKKGTSTSTPPVKKPRPKATGKNKSLIRIGHHSDYPNKPKKPPTAFFYFLEDFRKSFQEENPDIKSMRDIGKACGEKWKIMPFDEKVAYYDIATEKRAKFDEDMAEYMKKKPCNEEAESDVSY